MVLHDKTAQIRLGLWPFLVYRALGAAMGDRRTLELALTGRIFSAKEARELGLVHEVSIDCDVPTRFVTILDPKANGGAGLLYSTYIGGSHGDVPLDVRLDSLGNIYLTGYTLSPDFPVTGDAVQPQWGHGTNVFVTKFRTGVSGSAALQFSTYFGATGTSVPTGISVGPDGSIYVVGYASVALPLSNGAFQPSYGGGGSDGFVMAIGNAAQPMSRSVHSPDPTNARRRQKTRIR